jgi:2,4-dienoyl-CoA reductase-like NADH-dependent reductase (Old Yellow Enzyme family)/NADPH-dependent 2,4-dienoyl-CoA reductase/sulfur reductase-like enzyme
MALDHLFTPLQVGPVTIRNRIFSTGHQTVLVDDGVPNEALIAYQEARARGGAGLVIIEIAAIHETAFFSSHTIKGYLDDCIPGYQRLAKAVHGHGCEIFGQLFHPGREVYGGRPDGTRAIAWAPSAVPAERYGLMAKPLPLALIEELIEGYGDTALRMQMAGLDGVEVVASHGYLPAQFLNPRVNSRDDRYGGSFENRLRFMADVAANIRAKVGDGMAVGLRLSGDDMEHDGIEPAETLAAIEALAEDGVFDYYNVIAGSSATHGGAVHIVPSMRIETGYVAPFAATVKAAVDKPVFVAGRINQPQIAETIVASGQADMCGMTRAMICDPEMAGKAEAGRLDDIRACIACNQACIGHMQIDAPISCIQHPETGREIAFGAVTPASAPKTVMVVGGGPGGMKAAAVAAERGHRVTLYERGTQLGGQVLLAQLLPGRAEFGGIVSNFTGEMARAGVTVETGIEVDAAMIREAAPDAVVLATGATPRWPAIEGVEDAHVVDAWQVLRNEANVGGSVVIADWLGDWIGLGLAEQLALAGHRVRYATTQRMAGEGVQSYIRDQTIAELTRLGVEMTSYARLFGVDADTAYFMQTTSGEPIVMADTETVVLALGHDRDAGLEAALTDYDGEIHVIGDCVTPRTVEEAVLEGLEAGSAI